MTFFLVSLLPTCLTPSPNSSPYKWRVHTVTQVSFGSSVTDWASFLPQHLPCNKGLSHYPGQRNGVLVREGSRLSLARFVQSHPLNVSNTMCGDPEFRMSQVPGLSLAIVLIPSRIPSRAQISKGWSILPQEHLVLDSSPTQA